MVKMVISEVQAQTEDIKAFCQEYQEALEEVMKATMGFLLTPNLKGQAMDSMKRYLSFVYPAACKANILYGEAFVQANENYLNDYLAEFGAVDLDSEKLEEQIQKASTLMQQFEQTKENLEMSKRNLPESQRAIVEHIYQGLINCTEANIQVAGSQKAKLEEKLAKFLAFDARSSSYFSDLSDATTLMNKGMAVIGKDSWDGNGFSNYDTSWTKEVEAGWQNREFVQEYGIERPKDMTEKEYKTYLTTLRKQEETLKKEGWDGASLKAYFDYVSKQVKDVSVDKVLDVTKNVYVEAHKVGSEIYTIMFDAFGTIEGKIPKGKEVEVNQKKLQLMLDQMGGYVDEYGMLQLKNGKYAFDSNLAPHASFYATLRKVVQTAYPTKEGLNANELGRKIHLFRSYIDKQNIDYIRNHFEGANDYEKLQAYAKKYQLEFDYTTGANYHNRTQGAFDYPRNMKVQVPKGNTLDGELNNARMSEFIVNLETGNFVSEWNVYKKNQDGTYDFNYDHYNINECGDIANTESFNYGVPQGKNKDVSLTDRTHKALDVDHPDDGDIRNIITNKNTPNSWKSEGDYDKNGNYADIVKEGGKADVEAWRKVPENKKQEAYKGFVEYCRSLGSHGNDGFDSYCKEKRLYKYK